MDLEPILEPDPELELELELDLGSDQELDLEPDLALDLEPEKDQELLVPDLDLDRIQEGRILVGFS